MKSFSDMTPKQIFEEFDRRDKERAEKMPDEKAALNQMFEAYQRLKDLGWNHAMYCPKDGTVFDAISAGSTGICPTCYRGEWPDGKYWGFEASDMWPSNPILFKLKEKDDG